MILGSPGTTREADTRTPQARSRRSSRHTNRDRTPSMIIETLSRPSLRSTGSYPFFGIGPPCPSPGSETVPFAALRATGEVPGGQDKSVPPHWDGSLTIQPADCSPACCVTDWPCNG